MVAVRLNAVDRHQEFLAGKQAAGVYDNVADFAAGVIENHVLNGPESFIVHAINVGAAHVFNVIELVIAKNAVMGHGSLLHDWIND